MATFPTYIKPRAKGQRRDKFIDIDYNKVQVVGEYDGIFGYETQAVGELLLVEFNGMLYPCYRRKSPRPGVITAICQDFEFKACRIEAV